MPVQPVTPAELCPWHPDVIPEFVVSAWNTVIRSKLRGRSATFSTVDLRVKIIEEARQVGHKLVPDQIPSTWFALDERFQEAGWNVTRFDGGPRDGGRYITVEAP